MLVYDWFIGSLAQSLGIKTILGILELELRSWSMINATVSEEYIGEFPSKSLEHSGVKELKGEQEKCIRRLVVDRQDMGMRKAY